MTTTYTTRADAEFAVRDAIYNVSTPASAALVAAVADRCWMHDETVDEALTALAAEGVDCEGFDRLGPSAAAERK